MWSCQRHARFSNANRLRLYLTCLQIIWGGQGTDCLLIYLPNSDRVPDWANGGTTEFLGRKVEKEKSSCQRGAVNDFRINSSALPSFADSAGFPDPNLWLGLLILAFTVSQVV